MEIGKEEEALYGTAESGSEYSSYDSGNDLTYSILEETHSKLSKLSIKNKKAKARLVSVFCNFDFEVNDLMFYSG